MDDVPVAADIIPVDNGKDVDDEGSDDAGAVDTTLALLRSRISRRRCSCCDVAELEALGAATFPTFLRFLALNFSKSRLSLLIRCSSLNALYPPNILQSSSSLNKSISILELSMSKFTSLSIFRCAAFCITLQTQRN